MTKVDDCMRELLCDHNFVHYDSGDNWLSSKSNTTKIQTRCQKCGAEKEKKITVFYDKGEPGEWSVEYGAC